MRNVPNSRVSRHAGFTLVEVMVAAALSVVIMTIIATAFQTGLEATSQLKSIGAIASQLRQADGIMRSDLRAFHLWNLSGTPPAVLVSDLPASTIWGQDPGDPTKVNEQGFFRLQGSPSTPEGMPDGYNVASSRATDHWMHFTVRLSAATADDAFVAYAPPEVETDSQNKALGTSNGQFAASWAEVAYFLQPMTGQLTTPDATGTALQLYTLRRRQRVMADADLVKTIPSSVTATDYPELSLYGGIRLNTPMTIAAIGNRLFGDPPTRIGLSTTTSDSTLKDYRGSDLVLANVVSMRIQVLVAGAVEYADIPGGVFDTNDVATNLATIRAIRITLRIYDPKNRLTRQVSIDQAL